MSGEVPRSKRIAFAKLQPGDLVFFGPRGRARSPRRSATRASTSAAAGSSTRSGEGVAVAPLTGWYRQTFAWGRRPLAEAGLVSGP